MGFRKKKKKKKKRGSNLDKYQRLQLEPSSSSRSEILL